jgi:CHRD domain-containing protein
MKRIAIPWTCMALLACTGSNAANPAAKPGPETFQAKLDATNEVPPPSLSGNTPSGSATFKSQGNAILYKVTVTGLSSPYVAAHVHTGAPGVAGPVIVALTLTGGPDGSASGEGTFDASAIKGKKADGSPMSMADLLAAMRSGATYVNVHTANNKPGEARGQIQP